MTRWYRAYVGTVSDPKIAGVAHAAGVSKCVAIAIWHFILERAADMNNGGAFKMDGHQICATLDLDMDVVKNVWGCFIAAEMLGENQVLAWKKRQYETDKTDPTNAERKQRWRERSRNGIGTVAERPDTDTDTEKNIDIEAEFEKLKSAYPKRKGSQGYHEARRKFEREVKSGVDPASIVAAAKRFTEINHKNAGTEFIPMLQTWMNQRIWTEYVPKQGEKEFIAVFVRPSTPQFEAWKQYAAKHGKKFLLSQLSTRELEGRPYPFESEWPPEEANKP